MLTARFVAIVTDETITCGVRKQSLSMKAMYAGWIIWLLVSDCARLSLVYRPLNLHIYG